MAAAWVGHAVPSGGDGFAAFGLVGEPGDEPGDGYVFLDGFPVEAAGADGDLLTLLRGGVEQAGKPCQWNAEDATVAHGNLGLTQRLSSSKWTLVGQIEDFANIPDPSCRPRGSCGGRPVYGYFFPGEPFSATRFVNAPRSSLSTSVRLLVLTVFPPAWVKSKLYFFSLPS